MCHVLGGAHLPSLQSCFQPSHTDRQHCDLIGLLFLHSFTVLTYNGPAWCIATLNLPEKQAFVDGQWGGAV